MISLLRRFVAFLVSRIRFGRLEPYLLWFLTGRRPSPKMKGHVRQGFVFLINQERVMLEVTELSTLKIAAAIGVPPGSVTATFEISKGRPVPVFQVSDPPNDMDPDVVKTAIEGVYMWMKLELAQRFADLGSRRSG